MINREDSALIARELQNRGPANASRNTTKTTQTKTVAADSRAKPPLRAWKSVNEG